MKGLFKLSLVLLSICVLMIGYVYATSTNPTGPQTITRVADEKFNASSWPAIQINAEAGNVTELTISSLTQTQTWQGYYGNITGTIVLDDVQNWTMYSWATAEPQGEIYASNGSSVTWSKIRWFRMIMMVLMKPLMIPANYRGALIIPLFMSGHI